MNILIVTQYFYPENFRVNDFAVSLKERGHQVTVLTGIPNYPGGHFYKGYGIFKSDCNNFNGVNIIRVPLIPRGEDSTVRLALNYISFAFLGSILAPILCREKYDMSLVYGMSPILMALPALVLKKIRGVPAVLWVQDLWPESVSATGKVKSRLVIGIIKKIVRFIYRNSDRILVQSKAFTSSIRDMGADAGKILYFPNSAEDLYHPVNPESCTPERSKMPGGFCVMYAGNVGRAQDFGTVLTAAEKTSVHKDIHWIIIGDGCMSSWVKNEIKRGGLTETVHLFGRHPIESMPRYFSLADAMLVTLKKDPIFALTIPAKMQSYLACAKPVIAALDGEGARIVGEASAGITCPAENPELLAKAVLTMSRLSESERQIMGSRGKVYYEKHFERKMLMDKFEEIMINLIETKKEKVLLCKKEF